MGLLYSASLWLALTAPEGMELEEHAEAHGFGIGTDILGSNVINIALIVVLLVYLVKNVLSEVLAKRKAAIVTEISEAEQRQQVAIENLAVRQQNLAQAQQEAERIKQQAELNAQKLRTELLAQIESEIERLRAAADKDMNSQQDRIIQQLRLQLVEQVLAEVEAQLPQLMTPERQHRLIDQSIEMLGGR